MLTATTRNALLTQVACGDAELRAALDSEVDLLYTCIDTACSPRLKYLHTQLGLIEIAQIWARNKIDTTTRQLAHTTTEKYTSTGLKRTDSESTATGSACTWTAATNQHQFTRSSTDDVTAFTEHNQLRTAQSSDYGYDVSHRSLRGNGFSFNKTFHGVDDRGGDSLAPGAGDDNVLSSSTSTSQGGTGPLVKVGAGGIGTYWAGIFQTKPEFPWIEAGGPQNVPSIDGESGFIPSIVCPPNDPEFPFAACESTTEGLPSMGYGFHGHYEVSLAAPPLGIFKIIWDDSQHKRRYYHCSRGVSSAQMSHTGRHDQLDHAVTIARPEDNRSGSSESNSIVHIIRRDGISTRRGNSTSDAQERIRGVTDGSSHNESKRTAKGNATQQRRAESLTVSDTKSSLRRVERLTDDEVRRSYGQISVHLGEMWKRILDLITTLEKELSSIAIGGSMCIPCTPLGGKVCTPYASSMSRSYYR